MMSDILLERASLSEDSSFKEIKQKVEIIIETLLSEKQHFEKVCQQKIARCQIEMRLKDSIIEELRDKLQASSSNYERISREAQSYKAIINDLKQQFNRMTTVVDQISPRRDYKQLKRVKSDYMTRKSTNSAIKQNNYPIKIKKIDINNYFQEAKTKTTEMNFRFAKGTSSNFNDNKSIASKTVKHQFQFREYCGEKDCSSTFTKTMQKWAERNNWSPRDKKKENYVRIRDYKQNQWQETV